MNTILVAILHIAFIAHSGELTGAKYKAPYMTYEACMEDSTPRIEDFMAKTGLQVVGYDCKPEYIPAPGQGI